jgi:nitrate reductase delta subunit
MTRRPDRQPLVWKIASVLLQYPDGRVYDCLDDVTAALAQVTGPAQRQALADVVHWLRATPPTQVARHHVETFDLRRRCSPYLTYYRYGDTRQRGMALLALKHTYRRAGLDPIGAELADYLPAVLEFAALAPAGAGHKMLTGHRAGLELLRHALHDATSTYAGVLDAVCAGLPPLTARQAADVRRLVTEGPPTEKVGLDPVGVAPFAPPEFLGEPR